MNQKLPYLLNKYLNKSCSGDELADFYALVNDPANELEFDDLLADAVHKTSPEYHLSRVEKAGLLEQVFNTEIQVAPVEVPLRKSRRWNWKKLTAAAAILFTIGTVGLYFFGRSIQKTPILPGGNKAVLTLANGAVINLEDAKEGELMQEGNVTIIKDQSGQLTYSVNPMPDKNIKAAINTLTTPRGGQYQLNLPDGSKVWLNAASSLKFPSTFTGLNQRKVELSGEAYFEVAKRVGDQKSFVVLTGTQEVEVLGTHFNVNAYGDETDTRTTLLEGLVKVTRSSGGKAVMLKPGQQSVLNSSEFFVRDADLEKSVDWKSGKFIFKNESLEIIMRKIARWYDVDVIYAENVPKQETFSGTVSRFDDVEKVLHRLELTGEVNFKINGRRITVLK